MNFLTYQSASEFCAFNNVRLPTEAEWEKAARGTDGRVFPWGEGLATCERAWVNDWYNTSCDDDGQGCTTGDDLTLMEIDLGCGQGRTTNVTNKSAFASPYGAVNMVGNVSEWVVDCYGANYYRSETMSYQNPKNVDECDSGDYGVLRGGSFSDKSRNLDLLLGGNMGGIKMDTRGSVFDVFKILSQPKVQFAAVKLTSGPCTVGGTSRRLAADQ